MTVLARRCRCGFFLDADDFFVTWLKSNDGEHRVEAGTVRSWSMARRSSSFRSTRTGVPVRKTLAPTYDALAASSDIPVVKVDAADHLDVVRTLPNNYPAEFVEGYLTVLHFQGKHGVRLDKRDLLEDRGIEAHNQRMEQ